MSLAFEALLLGLILSLDSFSAAVAMGFRTHNRFEALRFAFCSGAAEVVNTLIGVLAGSFVLLHFGSYDHWVAFALLSLVACNMGYEGVRQLRVFPKGTSTGAYPNQEHFHHFGKILLVSFATSLDALGVGMSLGVSAKPIAPFVISIGLCASLSTLAGLFLAKKLSRKFGPAMSLIGAAILFVVALQMLQI